MSQSQCPSPEANTNSDLMLSVSDLEEDLGSGEERSSPCPCLPRCRPINLNITVTNTAACLFVWPLLPRGHPKGRVNWMAVCFLLLWLLGLLLSALGSVCLLADPNPLGSMSGAVCGDEDGVPVVPVVYVCVGGVFALLTVPLACCVAVCTQDDT
jgi:hypothetical protein